MAFEGRGEEDDVVISDAVIEVKLVIVSEDDIEVEALDGGSGESPDKTSVRIVADLSAQLSVFVGNLASECSSIAHL